MNLEHLNIAIAVMQRVVDERRPFDMKRWQHHANVPVLSESELCECGTAACFAGWLAVSPEFQAVGGEVNRDGAPKYQDRVGEHAIVAFLGGGPRLAVELCGITGPYHLGFSGFYGCMVGNITAQMVLDKLIALREEHS